MPYSKKKSHPECPATKPIGVVKDSDGKLMGCHASDDDANAQLAALHASESGKAADMSLMMREEMVHRAVDEFFNESRGMDKPGYGYGCGVFDTYVIVKMGEYFWRVDYTVGADNEVELAEQSTWVRVENAWVEAKMVELGLDSLAAFGDQIKATKRGDEGVVEAIGIRFSDDTERDLEGDYFQADTDYGPGMGDNVAATLNHRMPMVTRNTTAKAATALQRAATTFFKNPVKTVLNADIGIVAQHILDLSDDYEKMIFELVQKGKFRWSSGSAPHMVDRDPKTGKIKTWHIIEWAYTPFAAEPRLPVIAPTKSLAGVPLDLDQPQGPKTNGSEGEAGDTAVKSGTNNTDKSQVNSKGKRKMDEKEMQLFQEQFAKTLGEFKVTAVEAPIKSVTDRLDTFEAKVTKLLNMFEELPESQRAGFMTNDGGTKDAKAKSFGDFLLAVRRNDVKRLTKVYGSRLEASEGSDVKATMVEDSGQAGGYLVPEEFATTLLQVTPMTSPILSRVQIIPVARASGEWPALDQYFAPTAGVGDTAFAGRVTTDITAEAGILTETEPQFKMLQWRVHKVGGFTQVSNELIADSPLAIEALLRGLFNVAISAKQEYFILRGNGVGSPLGILNSAAAVGVSPHINNLFDWVDVATMQSKFKQIGTAAPVWLMHPSIWPDILQMEVGTQGAAAWTANMQAAQGNMLNGYQLVQSEHLPQANNAGAVILADLYAYVLWRREALSIAFSEHYGFLNDLGTWRFTARADGQPWLRAPITLADPQGGYQVSPFVYHND